MRRVLTLYSTTIGKKVVMASTGILLVGFVIGHMLGNLKLYMTPHDGDYALDHYAEGLRTLGDPFLPETGFLWIFRVVMLGAVALHVWSAWSLKRLSDGARSVKYKKSSYEESNAASRTMFWGGLLLAAFIVFHILHFTTGTIAPGFEFRHGEVQANVTGGLSVWWVALFYVVAMVALGMHLYHGVWSMLQTLGVNHPRYNSWRRKLAIAIAVVIAIANISFPLAILSGAVGRT
jgi:succinate dehydrogenase / fumarate reductase cytochrome b subunit